MPDNENQETPLPGLGAPLVPPGIGHNNPPITELIGNIPDFGAAVTASLMIEHAQMAQTVDDVCDELRGLPDVVETDEDVSLFTAAIKKARDNDSKLEKLRVGVKEPYLRGSNAIDNFFFGLRDRLQKRPGQRSARPGVADEAQAKLHKYNQEKLAREQAERQRVADEQRRQALAAQTERDRLIREAEEAAAAAARARKPETKAAKQAVADTAQVAASVAASAAVVTTDAAREAHVGALAKPADIVRMRTDQGALNTMAREAYAEIEDRDLLDMAKLWPFLKDEHIAMALRAWAKTGNHAVQMPGALIGFRNKTVVR